MRTMAWSSKAADSVFSAQQLSATQGHTTYFSGASKPASQPRTLMCPMNFYTQWVFLWACAVETMARARVESFPSHALRHIGVALFPPHGEQDDFVNIVPALRLQDTGRIRAHSGRALPPGMLPHKDTLVQLVYWRALCSISVKVQTMLRTTEVLTERELTMVNVVNLYMRAAYRRDQSSSGLDAALHAPAPIRQPPQQKKPPAGQPALQRLPPGAAPKSPAAPRVLAPQRTPGPDAGAPPPREAAGESTLLLNPTNMSPAQRTVNRKGPSIRCHNCTDGPAYPKHPPVDAGRLIRVLGLRVAEPPRPFVTRGGAMQKLQIGLSLRPHLANGTFETYQSSISSVIEETTDVPNAPYLMAGY